MRVQSDAVRVIRITTDDLKHRFWVAAMPPEEAITRVLNDVPEGWSAALLNVSLTTTELALLNLQSGEIRELKDWYA